MTALTLDQLLETEALLYAAARTGLDDSLKITLTEAVDCIGDGAEGRISRAHELLKPVVMRDEHCRAAQGMLCRAIGRKLDSLPKPPGHFHIGGASWIQGADRDESEAMNRRMQLMLATLNAYQHDNPGYAWRLVERCTTADRAIVMGFTASMLHKSVTGRVLVDPFGADASTADQDDEGEQ